MFFAFYLLQIQKLNLVYTLQQQKYTIFASLPCAFSLILKLVFIKIVSIDT